MKRNGLHLLSHQSASPITLLNIRFSKHLTENGVIHNILVDLHIAVKYAVKNILSLVFYHLTSQHWI